MRCQRDAAGGFDVRGHERRPGAGGVAQGCFPGGLRRGERRCRRFQRRFERLDALVERGAALFLIGRGEIERRFAVARAVAGGAARVGRRLEEREQAVVVLLAERVVLVVVALRAADGAAEPDGGGRVDAVDERLRRATLRGRRRLPRSSSRCDGSPRRRAGRAWRSGSMSPAICSIVKRSKGMSALRASITQSRYGQIERRLSFSWPLVSA